VGKIRRVLAIGRLKVAPLISEKDLYAASITTPLGDMFVMCDDTHLHMLEFCDLQTLEKRVKAVQQGAKATIKHTSGGVFNQVAQELAAYFAGERGKFTVACALHGSHFSQQVWQFLCSIPVGTTRSYKEQAEGIRRPTAYRAVARANSQNKIAIIVPCHRVIGSNGKLTGYAGGIARKQWLLEHEKKYFLSFLRSRPQASAGALRDAPHGLRSGLHLNVNHSN